MPKPFLMAARTRKSTQRERLLNGLIEVANRHGYAGASISAIIAEARVSRPTYYDYFTDRDDCFTATIWEVHGELHRAVKAALAEAKPEDAVAAAIGAMVDYAGERPARARFLLGESMSGGPEALEARDEGIAVIAGDIAQAERSADPAAAVCDLDPRIAIGSVYRLIATRLRRGEVAISSLLGDLLGWLAAYQVPSSERRWLELAPGSVPPRSPYLPDYPPVQQMPKLLPPGRPRIPEAEVAENHRARILYAAARLAEEKGYLATTIADITRLARIDGRVFYRLFSDKQEAFAAVHELGFQLVMDVTAKAFFAVEGWPLRSWEAGRALTQLLQENPLIARVGFVEAYAVGPGAVQRIEDSHTAFMFFLQEGLIHSPSSGPPSRVAMEATISAVFEIIYLQSRSAEPHVAAMLPQIAHVWLAPFLGAAETNAFIDAQTGALGKATRRAAARRRPRDGR
jgi:AcrR family transcriptional regulator